MTADVSRSGIARYLSDGWDGVAIRMISRVLFCGAVWWFFPFVGTVWFIMGTLREASHVAYILRRRTPSRRVDGIGMAATMDATIDRLGPIPDTSDPRLHSPKDGDAPSTVTGRGILATLALFWAMGVIWALAVAQVPLLQAAGQGLSLVMIGPIFLGLLFGAVALILAFLGDPIIDASFGLAHLVAAAIPHLAWRIRAHDAVDAKAEAVILWTRRPKEQPLFPRPAVSRRLWTSSALIITVVFAVAVLVAA